MSDGSWQEKENNNTRHDRNSGAKLDGGTTGRIFDDLLCEGKYVLVGKDALINLFNKVAVSKKKYSYWCVTYDLLDLRSKLSEGIADLSLDLFPTSIVMLDPSWQISAILLNDILYRESDQCKVHKRVKGEGQTNIWSRGMLPL
jgi:hypothetical protein